MQKGRLTSGLRREPGLCCCRSSQRSVSASLEMRRAALKRAAFTTHTQTDPVRSINTRRQRLTAQNKQVTLAIDCIENPSLWILHESWPKNRQSLSCPGFERSVEKLYRLPHHRIWATLPQSNCRGVCSVIHWLKDHCCDFFCLRLYIKNG